MVAFVNPRILCMNTEIRAFNNKNVVSAPKNIN